jgi:hypothetical protein
MILHRFPMYIRYSFAWYGWYLPKIDRGTHIFRYEIELDPGSGIRCYVDLYERVAGHYHYFEQCFRCPPPPNVH